MHAAKYVFRAIHSRRNNTGDFQIVKISKKGKQTVMSINGVDSFTEARANELCANMQKLNPNNRYAVVKKSH